MPHFLTRYVRKHFTKDDAAQAASTQNDTTRAEQLEHISAYARAGYFNMGYTVDAFQLPGESALH